MNRVRVVHRDRLYVPAEAVDGRKLRELAEMPYQTKQNCHPSCPLARHQGRFCSTCPGRDARIKLWSLITTPRGRRVVAIAGGDRSILDEVVKGPYEVIDRRSDPPFRTSLRWTGQLRTGQVIKGRATADQKGMLTKWRKVVRTGQTGGTIVSPPRSGKCVFPDTMIRTNRGYHHISDLLVGREGAVEVIGRFGQIATSQGVHPIRGLYAKTIDETIEVTLVGGITLGGSPNHPVMIRRSQGKREFQTLGSLRGDEALYVPRVTADPVPEGQGLSEAEAMMVGKVILLSDESRFQAGVVHLPQEVLVREPQLVALLETICRIRIDGGLMIHVNHLPVLRNWVDLLMSSSIRAWRAFAREVMLDAPTGVATCLPDRDVARALQMYLLGQGVVTFLSQEEGNFHMLEVGKVEDWETFLRGGPVAGDLYLKIVSVHRSMLPRRVMDVMVPGPKSFVSNGLLSHNTVIGVAAVLAERSRAYITASKIDFLRQFGKRFGELTNLRELHRRGQTPVVLIDPSGWKDAKDYGVTVYKKWCPEVNRADVVMSAYQQFMDSDHGRRRKAQYLDGKFGLVVSDECITADTPVVTELNGTTMTAKELYESFHDAIVARSHDGVRRVRPILRKFRKTSNRGLVVIRYEGGELRVTPDDLIWLNGKGWTRARDVAPGDDVETF